MTYWLIKYISSQYGYEIGCGIKFKSEQEAREYMKKTHGEKFKYQIIRVDTK